MSAYAVAEFTRPPEIEKGVDTAKGLVDDIAIITSSTSPRTIPEYRKAVSELQFLCLEVIFSLPMDTHSCLGATAGDVALTTWMDIIKGAKLDHNNLKSSQTPPKHRICQQ